MSESTALAGQQGTIPAPEARRRLVVVGFGMVAHKLVERLAALDALGRFEVTVVGEEPYPAYDRVHLTGWFEHRDRQRLALGGPDWSRDMGIRAVTGTPVRSIDRDAKAVRTGDGERIPYDRLVLATGSSVFVPPIEGADADGVFPYRTIDDLGGIVRRAARASRVIVVGGGVLGIEVANALRRLGLGVVMLEAGPCLMRRQLDWDAAGLLEARVRELGIGIVAGARARGIETREDGQLVLALDGGRPSLVADMIVMASGVRPAGRARPGLWACRRRRPGRHRRRRRAAHHGPRDSCHRRVRRARRGGLRPGGAGFPHGGSPCQCPGGWPRAFSGTHAGGAVETRGHRCLVPRQSFPTRHPRHLAR